MRKLELSTSRLNLVLPDPSEAAATLAYYSENREHLRPTEPRVPDQFFTVEFRRERLVDNIRAFGAEESVRLFLELKDYPGKFVGVVNLSNIIRAVFQAAYLGYSIAKCHEGKGLMSEAIGEVIRYAFSEKKLHRLMANHLPENRRSAAILARHGFQTDGTSPKYLYIDGEWRDHVLTSLVNPSWQPREQDRAFFGLV